eukprot:GHVP01005857.1.p1 GENE.GHVP01005857.1~~GHVP01005857.1.p1  ORF type:complete len:226 (-),score=41.97 GHVP01005857.1:615-1292(-)
MVKLVFLLTLCRSLNLGAPDPLNEANILPHSSPTQHLPTPLGIHNLPTPPTKPLLFPRLESEKPQGERQQKEKQKRSKKRRFPSLRTPSEKGKTHNIPLPFQSPSLPLPVPPRKVETSAPLVETQNASVFPEKAENVPPRLNPRLSVTQGKYMGFFKRDGTKRLDGRHGKCEDYLTIRLLHHVESDWFTAAMCLADGHGPSMARGLRQLLEYLPFKKFLKRSKLP